MTLRAILKIQPSPLARELTHVIDLMDLLHKYPPIPAIPVVLTKSRFEEGAYHSLARPNRPVKIAISQYADHPGLTLVHETAHLLDHLALNSMGHGFGSEGDPAFEQLWNLWRASRMTRKLEALLARRRRPISASARRFVRYQMQPSELWARSYTQWVVKRSDDLLLASQLRADRNQSLVGAGGLCDFYWENHDLDRIMDQVDRLLHQAGL